MATQDSLGESQHAEGIQHIASNATPGGTMDTSRGTEGGVGTGHESSAVSSAANTDTPVPNESTERSASQGGMMGTVKSYLGMGGVAGESGGPSAGQPTTNMGREWNQEHIWPGSTEASSADFGADKSHFGGTGGMREGVEGQGVAREAPGVDSEGRSAYGAGALGAGAGAGAVGMENRQPSTTMEAPRESVAQAAPVAEERKESAAPATEERKESAAPAQEEKKEGGEQKKGGKGPLENPSAIPTAGGERLGEKHWGESKIVPDVPQSRESNAGVSSEEGQPTQQTSDNTQKNTGGATGPPRSENRDDNSGANQGGEQKPGMMDKAKHALHMDKK